MARSESLIAYFESNPVGTLFRENQNLSFRYEHKWLERADSFPLSLSLPLNEKPFHGVDVAIWFGNLLPEGDILHAVARRLGRSTGDIFGLLQDIGGECAGAICLLPSDKQFCDSGHYQKIDDGELFTLVSEDNHIPLFAGEDGIRLSLAGAQNKIPVFIDEQGVHKTTGTKATTHILKPPIRSRISIPGTVENEAFCMGLASKLGLSAPQTEIRSVNGQSYYLVERFDRIYNQGEIRRLHQEDFCQISKIEANLKYEESGGPSLLMISDILNKYSSAPAVDGQQFLRWICFNFLIGNADAHGKNIALLYSRNGLIRLAPFYDLLCTAIYPELDQRLAMRIGGERRPDRLRRQHWEQLAKNLGLPQKAIFSELKRLTQSIEETAVDFTNKSFRDDDIITKILEIIKRRVGRAWAVLGGRPD